MAVRDLSDSELDQRINELKARLNSSPQIDGKPTQDQGSLIPFDDISTYTDDELDQRLDQLRASLDEQGPGVDDGKMWTTELKEGAEDFGTLFAEGVSVVGTPVIAGLSAKLGEFFGEREVMDRLNLQRADLDNIELNGLGEDTREAFAAAFEDREVINRLARERSPVMGNIGEALGSVAALGSGPIGRALSKQVGRPISKKIASIIGGGQVRGKIAGNIGKGLAFSLPEGIGTGIEKSVSKTIKGDKLEASDFITDPAVATALGVAFPVLMKASEPARKAFIKTFERLYIKGVQTLTGIPADLAEIWVRDHKKIDKIIRQMVDNDDPMSLEVARNLRDDIYKVFDFRRKILNKLYKNALEDALPIVGGEQLTPISKNWVPLGKLLSFVEKAFDQFEFHSTLQGGVKDYVSKNVWSEFINLGKFALRRQGYKIDKLGRKKIMELIRTKAKISPDELIDLRQSIGRANSNFYKYIEGQQGIFATNIYKKSVEQQRRMGQALSKMYSGVNDFLEDFFDNDLAIRQLDAKISEMRKLENGLAKLFNTKTGVKRIFGLRRPSNEIAEDLKRLDEIIGTDLLYELKALGDKAPAIEPIKSFMGRAREVSAARFYGPGGPGSDFLPIDATGKSALRFGLTQLGVVPILTAVGVPAAAARTVAAMFTSPLVFKNAVRLNMIPAGILERLGGNSEMDDMALNAFTANLFSKIMQQRDENLKREQYLKPKEGE